MCENDDNSSRGFLIFLLWINEQKQGKWTQIRAKCTKNTISEYKRELYTQKFISERKSAVVYTQFYKRTQINVNEKGALTIIIKAHEYIRLTRR